MEGRYVLEGAGKPKSAGKDAFGYRKAWYDHNINTRAIKVSTQSCFEYELYQAYRYNYRAVLIHIFCSPKGGCVVFDEVTTLVSMDRTTQEPGGFLGSLLRSARDGHTAPTGFTMFGKRVHSGS